MTTRPTDETQVGDLEHVQVDELLQRADAARRDGVVWMIIKCNRYR